MAKKPERTEGCVGDSVIVEGRIYEKRKSGMWALQVSPELLEQIHNHYVLQSKSIREVSQILDIPHSHVQKICNEQKWMRTHYGRKLEHSHKALEFKEAIHALYIKGYVPLEIAKFLKLRVGPVREIIREFVPNATTSGDALSETLAIQKSSGRFSMQHRRHWMFWINYTPTGYSDYKRAIRRLTALIRTRYKETGLIESYELLGDGDYQLDHKYSIYRGYYKWEDGRFVPREKFVPIRVMAHPCNLQVISAYANNAKNNQCSIGLKELRENIRFFNKEYGRPYTEYSESDLVVVSREDLKQQNIYSLKFRS